MLAFIQFLRFNCLIYNGETQQANSFISKNNKQFGTERWNGWTQRSKQRKSNSINCWKVLDSSKEDKQSLQKVEVKIIS